MCRTNVITYFRHTYYILETLGTSEQKEDKIFSSKPKIICIYVLTAMLLMVQVFLDIVSYQLMNSS